MRDVYRTPEARHECKHVEVLVEDVTLRQALAPTMWSSGPISTHYVCPDCGSCSHCNQKFKRMDFIHDPDVQWMPIPTT